MKKKKNLVNVNSNSRRHTYICMCVVVHRPRKHTVLSSQENDSMPLWPLDRACHHYALVTLYKYSLLASLTAFHLPYQYYISMYLINPL